MIISSYGLSTILDDPSAITTAEVLAESVTLIIISASAGNITGLKERE